MKTRNLNTLIGLVLERIINKDNFYICNCANQLLHTDKITKEEYNKFMRYFNGQFPTSKKNSEFMLYNFNSEGLTDTIKGWWTYSYGDKNGYFVRANFLTKLLKKTERKLVISK